MKDQEILKVQLMTTKHIANILMDAMKSTKQVLKKAGENKESEYGQGFTEAQNQTLMGILHLADGFELELKKIEEKKIISLEDFKKGK